VSPSVVSEQESSFQVPLSEYISEADRVFGTGSTITSFDNQDSILQFPALFIVVVVNGNSTVFSKAEFSQESVVIVELPITVDELFSGDLVIPSSFMDGKGSGHC